MNIELIEKNLKIIKSLDKSSLYKYLYDNKIKIIIYFLIIIIIVFSILYYFYQKYFIIPMNYSSYLNLENIKIASYKKNIKCALLITGNTPDLSPLISQKYFIYNELKPDIYCYFNDIDDNMKQNIKALLNPVQIIFDKNNISNDYEKVMKLNNLLKNNKKLDNYDIIIRIRGDVYVKEPIPNNIINNINNNTIYIPRNENSSSYYYSLTIGVNDYFSISKPNVFNIYSQFYNYLLSHDIKCNINEYLLKTYLTENNIKINEFNYDTVIYKLRTNQIGYIYTYIKQYIKKFNDKFHCILE